MTFLVLNINHQLIILVLKVMWFNDESRLLSDVAEGLITSSENPLVFKADMQ